jgi:acetyl-CoA acetyltransferase
MSRNLIKDTAIVGVGRTEYSTELLGSSVELAIEAISAAVADSGLEMADIDGIVKYTVDSSTSIEMLAANLPMHDLAFWAEIPHGGGAACASIHIAAMAVATGAAKNVVCFRAFTPGDFLDGAKHNSNTLWARHAGLRDFLRPVGWNAMVDVFAMGAQRHMHEFGTTEAQLGAIAMACQKHALANPGALRPANLTLDDYFNSPYVSTPLREADCFILPSVGACAVVVSSAKQAADLSNRPVFLEAAAAASGTKALPYWELQPFRRGDIVHTPSREVAQRLWKMTELRPEDIDVAEIYDCFSYTALTQIEDYGFCPKGEGGAFVEGGRIEIGGDLPVNTHGGHLGEAYIHGFTHVIEGVRQLRGTADVQVPNARSALVTAGTPSATSALLLRN